MTKKKPANSTVTEQAPMAINSPMGIDVSSAESDDDMTLEELSQQALDVVGGNSNASVVVNHVQIGKAYFAFTQTFGFIGTVIAKDHFGIHFSDTVWVAHAGFMTKMAATGKLNVAVPMLAKSFIPWSSIITLMEWNFVVPTEAVDE